ncbi:hypothetical protein BDZ45DRAFT_674278 [Acephala macrosclerotiorum]|nr:hypothetical protein BDZ45DRAFT_674278 [Acephala macrosclerotiorum]
MASSNVHQPVPHFPQTRMTVEQKALHQRIMAAADPASVTRAERNQIYLRPPPDEEDRLCREKVGLTMAELKDKVMTSPDTLTEAETDIIIRGASYDRDVPNSGTNALWVFHLLPDEYELAQQVRVLLANDYDNEVGRRAHNRTRAFDQDRAERLAQKRKERAADQAAKLKATRPQWLHDMFDAKLPQWGFVIFRTTYGEGTEQKWQGFRSIYYNTMITQLHQCWRRAASLCSTHHPVLVSDPSLDGADVGALRQRFKAMRKRNEIPNRIATDCFLVVDEAVLNHRVISSKTPYQAKAPGELDPWQDTLSLRAVDPDHDVSAPVPSKGKLSGFEGEITIPLPKVFDWLYYCFLAKSEDWETRYKVTKAGPARLMNTDTEMLLGSFISISSISFRNRTPATLNGWIALRCLFSAL